jgi:hypothetical protein
MKTAMRFLHFYLLLVSAVQAQISGPKVWRQTTGKDFQRGQLDSVTITRLEDGEVQLPHPLVRTRNDSVDNSVLRFAVYDEFGNYLRLWTEENQLFAEKHAPDGQVLIKSFQVNVDPLKERPYGYAGCFNDKDHGFAILWSGRVQPDQDRRYFIFVQFYDSTGTPIGSNQPVNETAMIQSSKPSAVFDDHENYWIFWDQGNWNKTAVYYQKYSKSGEKVGINQQLNPENYFRHEYSPLAAKDRRGQIVVAWSAIVDKDPISDYLDAYLRFFDREGVPEGPPQRVDDDSGEMEQRLTDICIDRHDNLLLVWLDRRGITDGNFYQVYAQLYNADGIPLGRNQRVGDLNPYHDGGLGPADIVLLPEDEFQISWEGWHMGSPPTTETVVNQWKIIKIPNGEFTSSIFDAGPGGADWRTLQWSEEAAPDMTSIKFKMRSSRTSGEIESAPWHGPISPADFYTSFAGQTINPIHDGDRYVQYKAFLTTQIPGTTPVLKDVSLWFTTLDSIAPQIPRGLSTQEDIHQIRVSWAANNEPDLRMYKLYRGRVSQNYDVYWTKEVSATHTSYLDTNVVTGATYFYAIAAVDSNLNESPLSGEVFDSPLGGNLYVDDQADPGGDGSLENPFSTISAGLEAAVFGDTVNVLPGNYAESVVIGKGVALVGAGANLTKIEGPKTWTVMQCGDSSLITGFTIINNSGNRAILCDRASPLITENVLINYGGAYSSGIEYGLYGSPRVTKNIISSFAIGIRDLYGFLKPALGYIRNNILADCSLDAIQSESANLEIVNNTIVQNENRGIRLLNNMTNALVMNNIVHLGNRQHGIGIYASGGSIICKYNNVVAAAPYDGCEPGEGSISAEPIFRQERPNDYRLQPDSPGFDAGNPAPEFNDHDGSRNDMGAFGGPDPMDANMFIEPATSVMVSGASGFPGDSIVVAISLSNLAGVCRAQFDLTYDENLLHAASVSKTGMTESFQLNWEESPGKVTLNLEGTSEIIKGVGEIASIIFVVDSASVAGQASALSLERIRIENCAGESFRLLQVTDGAFVVHLGSAGGRYVFVDQNNNGLEDGSRYHPYRTISRGILQATPGDTVLVAAGDYHERLEMREGVFVKGMGALVTRLSAGEEQAVIFQNVNQSGISGFTLESAPGGMSTIECYQSSPVITKNRIICGEGLDAGIRCADSSNPDIFNNSFHSNTDGIWISCFASSPHIHRNTFRGEDFQSFGIECYVSSKPVIDQNTFYGAQHGFSIISSGNASPQIMRNKFYCGTLDASAIDAYVSPELRIFNNTIQINGEMSAGIQLRSCQNAKIVNNTIYSDGGTAIRARESSWLNVNNIFAGSNFTAIAAPGSLPVDYSAFWDFAATMTDTVAGVGNIFADPKLVNPAGRNYRLAPNSPCFNAGHPAPEYNDLDGSRNDMGAYGGPFADSSAFESQQAILTISSAEAAPGKLAALPVESRFVAGVAEIQLTITYDRSVLRIEDVITADLTKSFTLTTNFSGNDSVGVALTSPVGISSEHGSLIQVVFKVNADADTGKSTPVSIKRASLRSEVSEAIVIGGMNNGQISITGRTSDVAQNISPLMPRDFELSQNYPNPFNSGTRIRYGIPNRKASYAVSIRIYNMLGQLTRTLVHTTQFPGYYTVQWDGKDDLGINVSSGLYLCVFKAGEVRRVRKMLVSK